MVEDGVRNQQPASWNEAWVSKVVGVRDEVAFAFWKEYEEWLQVL